MTIHRILSVFEKIIVVEGMIYYAMRADKESVSSKMTSKKPFSAVQNKNRAAILAAALETFSAHGYRGTRLEQIANNAGMSKPNVIYYFPNKEAIFVTLLNSHIDKWLAPLREIDPDGEPLEQVIEYVVKKVRMSAEMPRESRLFANEIVQGAPRLKESMNSDLKGLFDRTVNILEKWMKEGKLAEVPADHLIYSIWATTQHYADFEAQIEVLSGTPEKIVASAEAYLINMYTKLLKP